MQIICISRGTLSGGRQLAERLAEKLGYKCLSREQLIEAAISEGIQVGKLEMAMIKPGIFSERLALEREHYIAFTTSYICERAKEGPLVYHGRTGHLLLPGVRHVLRVRVVADRDYRIKAAMQQLGVDREKARRYLEEVDEDRRRWVHNLYGVSWEDTVHYDITINLEQLNVDNAASALTMMAQLPDFQMTPSSGKAMENLHVAARARLALARDERTYRTGFKVRADAGVVIVTYNPRDAKVAKDLPAVLKGLEGVKEIRGTMATTNILWIQENFSPGSESFKQVAEIATKWNAAVELVRFDSNNGDIEAGEEQQEGEIEPQEAQINAAAPSGESVYNGGIEDDIEESAEEDDGGMKNTLEELARLGRSGGGRLVRGGQELLLNSLDRTVPYTLVVIGDVFLSKGHAARTRLTREFSSFLSDQIRAPVVTAEEIKRHYLFSKRDAFRSIGFLVFVILAYYLVFSHQEPILEFLAGEGWKTKTLSAVAVFIVVPLIAYLYGNVTKAFLKLIKME